MSDINRRDRYAAALAGLNELDWATFIDRYSDDAREYRMEAEAAMAVADAEIKSVCGNLAALPADNLRTQLGAVLRRWGLLDEVNDPAATEAFVVTDLMAVLRADPEKENR